MLLRYFVLHIPRPLPASAIHMAVDMEKAVDVPSHRPSSDEITVHGDLCGRVHTKEKSEVSTVVDVELVDECPDGGWRAWFALLGVSILRCSVKPVRDG
jgi:hypothetical protein